MLLRTLYAAVLALIALPASGQLIVTEFLASNSNSIRDENNNTEDWIELQNNSAGTINLQGWYLTDEENQPRKWAFPAWTLNANGFVVVFASDNDRKPNQATPGQDNTGAAGQTKLHAKFRLNTDGEYLALTRDIAGGGVEVVQVFNPYPIQATDIAYGTQVTTTVTPLLAPGANAKSLVPSSANGGDVLPYASWTGAAASEPFNDSSWTAGTTAVGFSNAGVAVANLKLRLNSDGTTTPVNDTSGAVHHGTNNGATWVATSTDANGRTRHGALQFNATDSNGGLTGDQVVVPAHADFNVASGTIMFWIKTAGNIADGGNVEGSMLFDRRAGNGVGQGLVMYLRDAGNIQIQPSPGGSQPNTFQSTGTVKDDRWHHVAMVFNTASGLPCTFYIDGVLSGSQNNNGAWSFSATQQIEIGRSHDTYWRRFNGLLDDYRFYNTTLTQAQIQQIYNNEDEPVTPGTDLLAAMQNQNASAFVRIPFNVTDPGAFSGLNLTMNWNDGFVAWLNGTQVSSFAAPASPAYNSTATQSHSAGAPLVTAIPNPSTALRNGSNILAIQALNNTAANGTFSVLPQLVGTNTAIGGAGYLVSATPGATNSGAKTNVGPFVSNVTQNPTPRPTGTAASPPLTIFATVKPSLRPLAVSNPVQLKYLTMYGAETTVNMTATATANVYSAQIPTNALGAGQMLRWRVVATDNTGVPGTAPEYSDPTDNEQYYGTVAVDSTIETALPVLYFFVADPNAANNATGTRSSIFFKAVGDAGVGRFYDNVEVNVHGQSSSGFAKKSYDFDFNEDNRFEWNIANGRVKDINLMTNWGDKSKTHNVLTHEALAAVGSAYHWCFQVRVQQVTPANAATPANHFFSIADMMEDGDDDWLDRIGLDPEGSLYKAYNDLSNSGGLEKKTRKNETKADADALIAGLNPATALNTRRQYSYDNLDLPQCVSYYVGLAVASSQDHGHKNYYLYRDSNGTREWSILPWDTDLSWGRNWTDAGGYFTDTIYTNNALNHYPGYNDGGSQTSVQNKGTMNRLYQVMFDSPDFRKMYLRRLRTVMDTYLSSPGLLEARVNAMTDLMDLPAIGLSDADRDRTKWSSWGTDGGFTAGGQVLRYHTGLINTNYLVGRRNFLNSASALLYYADAGTPGLDSEAIPTSQPVDAVNLITLETVDFNPASGNQGHEYFLIRNSNTYAVDISGWHITGAINHTFKGGTVIPAGGGVTQNQGHLFVAKDPFQFRQRTVSPKANEFCFVQGPYSGQLSARGETIELRDTAGALLKTKSWTPAPTAIQNFLRVTELNYAPVEPTPAEKLALPGVVEGDFEFIELMNTGPSPLVLTGARFEEGIDFTFPTFTLPAGGRCLLVSNLAAFQLRYGNGFNIAGVYGGSLDNNGETLQLLDNVGENILEFRYENRWFPPSDEGGRSLVVRDANPNWQTYDQPMQWAMSGTVGGTPGAGDPTFANVYEGWRWDYFLETEFPTPLNPNAPAALTQDPDGDGMNNFVEYAFGRNPEDHDNELPLVVPSIVDVGGTNYLTATFRRRQMALDVTYVVEVCGDLKAGVWTPVNLPVGTPNNLGNSVEEVTFRDSAAFSASAPRFVRVRAVKP